jgi:hypothetical protein
MPTSGLYNLHAQLPVGTTAQRPTPSAGFFRYNSSKLGLEFYDGTQWVVIGEFVATGGTVSDSGGYRTHTFTSSGTFTVTSGVKSVELVAVAGGGGSGSSNGCSGGGAGGLVYNSAITVSVGATSVTVGGGGGGAPDRNSRGGPGGNSVFGSTTAIGGGGGGSENPGPGLNQGLSGGSGGGSVRNPQQSCSPSFWNIWSGNYWWY